MKKDVVIKVENLSKKYQIGKKQSYPTLRDQLMILPQRIFRKQKTEEFWALKNVSFEVSRGEVIGIIGKNGAGKSTLLKILSRIVEPTEGKITIRGKVASLLEVGTGFNPELTGRENIYLNGAILGLGRKEIDNKYNDIVEFSGVKKFLYTPVKKYSSGMHVRLAFSVAAHLDPEILLVDEVLAVGDVEFQKKCLGKMNEVAERGRTVIFVSHSLAAVRRLCDKVILLEKGNIENYGRSADVISKYLPTQETDSLTDLEKRFNPYGNNKIIEEVYYIPDRLRHVNKSMGSQIKLEVLFKKSAFKKDMVVGLVFKNQNEEIVTGINSLMNKESVGFSRNIRKAILKINTLQLTPGSYLLSIIVSNKSGRKDYIERALYLTVIDYDVYGSGYSPAFKGNTFYMDGIWSFK